MYPNLYYMLKAVFGAAPEFTKIFNSFGMLLALSFLCAAYTLYREFYRKQQAGVFTPVTQNYTVGLPVNYGEVAIQFVIGFLLGYKIIGGIVSGQMASDAQSYIASLQGSWGFGIATGIALAGLKYYEARKQQLPKPEVRTRNIWPKDAVPDITIIAAIFGLLGAKIFHFLENWSSFIQDPWGFITALGGLTFYGGLIVAAVAIFWYANTKRIHWRHMVDAVAPGLMLAYAVGRLGCQVSGDGDWGIYNSAYISTPTGQVVRASDSNNIFTLQKNDQAAAQHFARDMQQFGHIPNTSYVAPSFVPIWLVAMNYTHNVNEEGVPVQGCTDKYCTMLPVPVFPTPIYEFVICTLLFATLWALRKKVTTPGVLFGIYLIMNGAERFVIEKIRVNTQYHFWGLHPSQAEIISTCLALIGIGVILYCKKITYKPLTTK